MAGKLTQGNQSLAKAMQIAETMATSGGVMRLQDISESVGMPDSTVLRMINTFMKRGYIYQDPGSLRYGLTHKFSTLSSPVNLQESLKACGHQVMLDLCKEVGESCSLITEAEDYVIHIDFAETSGKLLAAHPYLGQTAPLYCTGTGKLLLLNRTEQELDAYIYRTEFRKFTETTITDGETLKSELEQIRGRNWAMDNEEYIRGIRVVSGGILDTSGIIIGGINISGPSARLTDERIPFLSQAVTRAANKISRIMGVDI